MNKRLLLSAAIVLAICIIGYFIIFRSNNNPTTNLTPTSTSTPSISIPIDIFDSNSVQTFTGSKPLSYTASSSLTVSFHGIVEQRVVNSGSNLYLNGNQVGQVEGMGLLQPSFSPTSKYFSFIETDVCGALCQGFNLYVLNLSNSKLSFIKAPQQHPSLNTIEVIQSYAWANNDTAINVTIYIAKGDEGSKYGYDRVSPIEVWQYDIATTKYTLLKTLPE